MKKVIKKAATLMLTFALVVISFVQVPAATVAEKRLNSFHYVVPTRTRSEQFAGMVDLVLAQITTPQMTNYQKIKACYDWLIVNCSYGAPITSNMSGTFYTYDDLGSCALLLNRRGTCDQYAYAFSAMTRALGFESYCVGGLTSKRGGGYGGHTWCVIVCDGVQYVFDPQIDDNLSKGGISYARFGKTYAEVSGKYIPQMCYAVTGVNDSVEFYSPIDASQITFYSYHD